MPCDPSDMVCFHKRIGPEEVHQILEASTQLDGPKAQEKEVVVETTVQEKNLTYPTDTKALAQDHPTLLKAGRPARDPVAPTLLQGSAPLCDGPTLASRRAEAPDGSSSCQASCAVWLGACFVYRSVNCPIRP